MVTRITVVGGYERAWDVDGHAFPLCSCSNVPHGSPVWFSLKASLAAKKTVGHDTLVTVTRAFPLALLNISKSPTLMVAPEALGETTHFGSNVTDAPLRAIEPAQPPFVPGAPFPVARNTGYVFSAKLLSWYNRVTSSVALGPRLNPGSIAGSDMLHAGNVVDPFNDGRLTAVIPDVHAAVFVFAGREIPPVGIPVAV